jgi:hypothetical protein
MGCYNVKCIYIFTYPTKTLLNTSLHPSYIPRPSHSYRFLSPTPEWVSSTDHELHVMKFYPLPSYPLPIRPKYSQHPILKHPEATFLPQFQGPSFTPIQNNRPRYLPHRIWYDMIWYDKIYIFNRSWVDTRWQQYITHSVDTRWQQYITHLRTNSTHNTEIGKWYIERKIGKCGPCPVLRIRPWYLLYNLGKSTEKPQLG